MTEADWLVCTRSWPLLDYLRGKVSTRKLWLFVAAFWRDGSSSFSEELSRRVAKIAEQLADRSFLAVVFRSVFETTQGEMESFIVTQDFVRAAYLRDFRDILFAGVTSHWRAAGWGDTSTPDAALNDAILGVRQRGFRAARWATSVGSRPLTDALRDIIGNPFLPTALTSTWLTWHDGLIVSMARRMYASRNFSDLPILADALEEAGCTNADILNHCRQPGDHVRGCWVVDLLLGKK